MEDRVKYKKWGKGRRLEEERGVGWDGWLVLTSKGLERVTVGELRLRGRRTWGSWRWLLEALEEEEGMDAGTIGEAPPDAAAEVLAPSSVSCWWEQHF